MMRQADLCKLEASLVYIEFQDSQNYTVLSCLKNNKKGAGEMAQWLRALAALPEGLSLIPSTHMVAHSHL